MLGPWLGNVVRHNLKMARKGKAEWELAGPHVNAVEISSYKCTFQQASTE